MTTCGVLLSRGIGRLSAAPVHERDPDLDARFEAQVLLAHVLGLNRARLLSHPESQCSASQVRHYEDLLARRAGGEPVAYLVGHREFWSLELAVGPAVLVPRPETELLVE